MRIHPWYYLYMANVMECRAPLLGVKEVTPSECLLSSFSVRRSRDMCEHYASCTSVDFIFQLRARPHGGGDRSESCDEAE